MSRAGLNPVLHYLRKALGAPEPGGVTDAELLRRYVMGRDEAAFELLLWRHGAMVLSVCRQVLRDAHAAEDVFQATFLVLVRKASSISRREALGAWLHQVAYRLALKVRLRQAKAAVRQEPATDPAAVPALGPGEADAATRELCGLLHEEVSRLPAKYRVPVVLCYFEGRTNEEAAHELGWTKGTLSGRLARAREMLRKRLLRRGVAVPAGLLAMGLLPGTASAGELANLVEPTIEASRLFAAGKAATAATALAEGVLNAMFWTKVKLMAVMLVAVGLLGSAVTVLPGGARAARQPEAGAAGLPRVKPEDGAQAARNRQQSINNLKEIALAMQGYADAHGHRLPAPAIYGKGGKALLSWRVALLPYLGQQELYRRFRLTEPWDSPRNKKLLSKMPKVYAPVRVRTHQPYSTFYQVFVSTPSMAGMGMMGGGMMGMMGGGMGMMGSGMGMMGGKPGMMGGGMGMMGGMGLLPWPAGPVAAFVKGQQARIPTSFTDGTSNTILVVEAGNAVPWTKPEDLHYAPDEPIPELGGLFPDVIHAVMVDGGAQTFSKKYDETTMRHAITRDDGHPIDLDKLKAPGVGRGGGAGGLDVNRLRKDNMTLKMRAEQAAIELAELKREHQRLLLKSKERKERRPDPQTLRLMRDNRRLKELLAQYHAEAEKLRAEIRRLKQTLDKEKDEPED